MDEFCVGCSRYRSGDLQGLVLAAVCVAPFLIVYHVALVAYLHRDGRALLLLVGLLGNIALGLVVKRAVKQPRPPALCALLGTCEGHGMPSSHAQAVAFAAAALLSVRAGWADPPRPAALRRRSWRRIAEVARLPTGRKPGPLAAPLRALEPVFALLLTVVVVYGRVYLGYHTWGQAWIGAGMGFAGGLVWSVLLARTHGVWAPPLDQLLDLIRD